VRMCVWRGRSDRFVEALRLVKMFCIACNFARYACYLILKGPVPKLKFGSIVKIVRQLKAHCARFVGKRVRVCIRQIQYVPKGDRESERDR